MTARSIESFIQPHILDAEEYVPILPLDILSEEIGIPVERLIKLDANENPFGTSPRVLEAIAACRELHIYPDPDLRKLREDLAEYTGFSPDHIVPGNGADELIDLLYRLVVAPGEEVIDSVPTFGMYSFSAGIAAANHRAVKRGDDYSVDVDALLLAIGPKTKIVWLTSPNNPTGNILPEKDARQILSAGVPTVVDEAYVEFSGGSLLPLLNEFENLIVLRTFSKWAGLAGMRVGYGVMSPRLARQLMKIKPPYNVSVLASVAARTALADHQYHRERIERIVRERERLYDELSKLAWLKPAPSQANFIFVRQLRGQSKETRDRLRERGILIRHYQNPLLRNGFRVSVGLPEHTDRLIEALKRIGEDLD